MIEPITAQVGTMNATVPRPILAAGCFGMLTLPVRRTHDCEMTHERFQWLLINRRPRLAAFNWPIAA
jgi:hypothetical protein